MCIRIIIDKHNCNRSFATGYGGILAVAENSVRLDSAKQRGMVGLSQYTYRRSWDRASGLRDSRIGTINYKARKNPLDSLISFFFCLSVYFLLYSSDMIFLPLTS